MDFDPKIDNLHASSDYSEEKWPFWGRNNVRVISRHGGRRSSICQSLVHVCHLALPWCLATRSRLLHGPQKLHCLLVLVAMCFDDKHFNRDAALAYPSSPVYNCDARDNIAADLCNLERVKLPCIGHFPLRYRISRLHHLVHLEDFWHWYRYFDSFVQLARHIDNDICGSRLKFRTAQKTTIISLFKQQNCWSWVNNGHDLRRFDYSRQEK